MADVSDHDAATLVALETAVEALPPLTRVVFLLHRVDDLSYDAIARRLSIGVPVVESGVADALYRLCCTLDGDTAERAMPEALADAHALLSRRYRRYCEDKLRALDITAPVPWNDGEDDDVAVTRAMLQSMVRAVLQAFILNQFENLNCVQIAERTGTCRWIVRGRMLRGMRRIARRPMSFERWLRDIRAADCDHSRSYRVTVANDRF
ncbi:MAG: subfamily polymerase sigma-24 subunit [Sphingomonas bacterium]|uniref:sigma-70 region 4 domain-containing protein n=1 Tax=Sphingomonas bacterium TaxID=1895847 RepID=UPI00261AC08A|nr:sigma-70 region 4 domain-containing protein [Sphingomonas bacterium]MDB5704691.1 subfamily polymerase sigma-24 subunit [Sphingomonas bacterium]